MNERPVPQLDFYEVQTTPRSIFTRGSVLYGGELEYFLALALSEEDCFSLRNHIINFQFSQWDKDARFLTPPPCCQIVIIDSLSMDMFTVLKVLNVSGQLMKYLFT